jgi:hypothetical protein
MALEKTDTLGIINNSPRARAIRHIQEWITDGGSPVLGAIGNAARHK